MMHKANKKYQAIILAGKELFWKHGFGRVSVEEVCKNAGVSKMTFYKYFRNKNELVKAILNGIIEKSMLEYREYWDSDLPFEKKVGKTIEFKMKYSADISKEFITDLYANPDPELKVFIQSLLDANVEMIRNDFTKAQKKGEISSALNIEIILHFINKIPELISDPKLTENYDSPQQLIREFMEFFFYGIIPRK